MPERIRARAIPTVPADRETLCREIYQRFSGDPDLLAIPVLEQRRPVGLVHREEFLLRFADQFGRALFEGKPVTQLMEARPLIIEGESTVDFVGQYVATERPSALLRGFIIVEQGRYLGVVSGLSLLQATMARLIRQAEELEQAREIAELANKSKTNFLATVSHELRTPLNAIIGFANFILTEPHGRLSPPSYGSYIRDISDSGEHLLNLINDILDMSRIEAGRLELWRSAVDPIELIRASLKMLTPQIERAGHHVTLDLDETLPDLMADERALKQVFLNLLSNAVKFTPPGGRITVVARSLDPDRMTVEVRDSGIGIPADKIKTVMKPFAQVDSSLSRSHSGTGLGLPLVKALVEAHGGTFQLDSLIDQGTTASITLPLAAVDRTEAMTQQAAPAAQDLSPVPAVA